MPDMNCADQLSFLAAVASVWESTGNMPGEEVLQGLLTLDITPSVRASALACLEWQKALLSVPHHIRIVNEAIVCWSPQLIAMGLSPFEHLGRPNLKS